MRIKITQTHGNYGQNYARCHKRKHNGFGIVVFSEPSNTQICAARKNGVAKPNNVAFERKLPYPYLWKKDEAYPYKSYKNCYPLSGSKALTKDYKTHNRQKNRIRLLVGNGDRKANIRD